MSDSSGCPERCRAAFLTPPVQVMLAEGEHLYKFVSIPVVRHRVLESPWWIRRQAFDDLQMRASRLKKPVADLVRSRLAIATEWNPGMDTMYVVVLARPVQAWEGTARAQRLSVRDPHVLFTGGGQQVCVPDLTWEQIAREYSGTVAG